MSALQETFDRIKKKKERQRKLRTQLREAFDNSHAYQQVKGELETVKAKKKQTEDAIHDEFTSELQTIDALSQEIKDDQQMLADLAITRIAKGQTIEVKDEHDIEYEPIFSVRFKKVQ